MTTQFRTVVISVGVEGEYILGKCMTETCGMLEAFCILICIVTIERDACVQISKCIFIISAPSALFIHQKINE